MHKDGRKERHDEANSRFSQFCERTPETHDILVDRHVLLYVKGLLVPYVCVCVCVGEAQLLRDQQSGL